jgi:hypothetical protein
VPNSEVSGPNFGKTGMQTDARQFVMPSTDYIAVTDNINQQISWAKKHGCSYLLQTALLANSQVSIGLMDLKSGEYVFERNYNIKSPNDLPSILERLENTLQHPEFAEAEVETAEKKSLSHLGSSLGYLYLKNIGHVYDPRIVYLWDKKTFWIEAVLSSRICFTKNQNYFDPGIRILYPFSAEHKTFYIGSGGGFSWRTDMGYYDNDSFGMFVENSFGYLTRRSSTVLMRTEAVASAIFHEKKAIGGGLRIIMGIN